MLVTVDALALAVSLALGAALPDGTPDGTSGRTSGGIPGGTSGGIPAGPATGPLADPDSDGDGLSDFQETHKYFTDPNRADSDGDGIPDSDWDERREFAYTVRRLVHVLPPVTPDVLCDDYQDARITDETEGYVELEVIHYPLNTVAEAIVADPSWRDNAARMEAWTRPGPTANWDPAMHDELVRQLADAGIDVTALDDRTLVEEASRWLLRHAEYHDGFTTFCSQFVDGAVRVHPDLVDRAGGGDPEKFDECWQRELFAKGMFEHAARGSCTSSAIYLNGCLRAIGIPTRIVLAIPTIDTSDRREPFMLAGIHHHRVRDTVEEATEGSVDSWTSHTFNEVFVGGRWRRLNYDRLGQNILDPQFLGLMTHVATFSDWADGDMASTWGVRQARTPNDDAFGGSNPYSTIALSDRFGAHATIDNPPPAGSFAERTIDRLWWFDEHPAGVDMRLDDPETAGHIVFHVEGATDVPRRAYKRFYDRVGKRFALRADGVPDVPARATRGYWVAPEEGIQHFYLRVEPADFPEMREGIEYRLVALDEGGDYAWRVADSARIVRGASGADRAPTPPVVADGRGAPAELSLGPAYWSDAPNSPTGPVDLGTGKPVLLVRMGPSDEFDQHKQFTEVADQRFFLEAPDVPRLKVGARVGGITTRNDSYLVIDLGPGDWNDLREGVEYTLRARNETSSHRWDFPSEIRIVRAAAPR